MRYRATAMALAAAMLLAACGGSSGSTADGAGDAAEASAAGGGDGVTLRYGLWDANQAPAYRQCADVFEDENPGIEIAIEQLGWGDYWNNLQTNMTAGNAPDVFTNHLSKYPEFASKDQLVDIQGFVERDGVDLGVYLEGLDELWTRDGERFGLPKDWDTIAVIYNAEMLEAAGIAPEELDAATWNPTNGGTFEQLIARLSLDADGNDGTSPDFDANNVEQYGFFPLAYDDAGGPYGQTQWSHFAVSNGWSFIDGAYSEEYFYDDPRLIESISWLQGVIVEKGYAPPFSDIASLGGNALFTSGNGALITDGSWMIGTYTAAPFEVGFARLPEGPEGRKSMFNGLADSIWAGTDHVDEAWEWVRFAASETCATIVGEAGVVFPAQDAGVDAALAAYGERGLDVSAFTAQATEPDGTFLFPLTDNASEITSIMNDVMDGIFLGRSDPAEALPAANERVNATFG